MAIHADFLGWARRSFTIVKEAAARFLAQRAMRMAAAIAFYTTFSLAPLLIFAVALAGVVFGKDAAEGKVVVQLAGVVGLAGAKTIQDLIENARQPDTGSVAAAVGAITLLLGATGVVVELKDALNGIWDVADPAKGGFLQILLTRLVSLAMVLAIGFLLLVSLLVSTFLNAIAGAVGALMSIPDPMLDAADVVVSLVSIAALFALIYKVVPDAPVRWRDVVPGAAVASALFAVGKFALGFYISHSSFASTYGAAGSLVALLVWVYYSAQILLFGAEIARLTAAATVTGGKEALTRAIPVHGSS